MKIVPTRAPLVERIEALHREIEEFTLARAKEIQPDGLPLVQVLMMIQSAGCRCQVAKSIVETIAKDAAIAARGKAIEDAARKAS